MKKILILCRRDNRSDYDQTETYRNGLAVIPTRCEYEFGELEQLIFSYDGKELAIYLNDKNVREYDELFLIGWFKTKVLEDIALSVAKYMEYHGKPIRNTEVLFTRSRSKLSQYVVASLHGIKLTPFLFCKDTGLYTKALQKYWTTDYPVIIKGIQASRGNDNYLSKDPVESGKILALTDSDEGPWFVTQGYVPNDGDYRIIVMGDEVKYAIHRKSQAGSHLNNTSKGGVAENIDIELLPLKVRQDCVRLSQLLRREITGVDMIQHTATGEFYLLEINNMPQLATGALVSEKLTRLDEYFAKTPEEAV